MMQLGSPRDAAALTSDTITIDGDFSDWVAVRSDPENVAYDTQTPMDPDWPIQPDRDIFYVNSTYDDEYLYFCWRRTAGGVKAITFAAYIDLDGDGLLNENRDKVVCWTVSDPAQPTPAPGNYDGTGRILSYYQARDSGGNLLYPAGDPMDHYGPPPTSMQDPLIANWQSYSHSSPHGDGNTPDGWALGAPTWGESYPAKTMDAYMDPVSGIEAEARVAWSDLGFTSDIPPVISIHFTAGNGESFGSANKTSLWPTDYKEVNQKLYESNRGQIEDNVRGLYWLAISEVDVSPDRSSGGAAGQTIVYEHTISNDGNGADVFDLTALSSQGWTVEIVDAGGNPVSSVSLGGYSTTTVFVRVAIPPGTPDGTADLTVLTAASRYHPDVTDSASDTTSVGKVTVTPNQAGSTARGQYIDYEFTVLSNLPGTTTYDLTTSSTLGFPNDIYDAGGNPITSLDLASGASATVRVRVQVPVGATLGTQDVMRLTATVSTDPYVYSSATGTTTVHAGLALEPNNAGYAGTGTWMQYRHTVTNGWPTERTIGLSGVSSRGWQIRLYASDGVTEVTSVDVGPNGDTEEIIVRVYVPAGVAEGTVDTTTITASAPGSPSDTAVDTTTVRRLLTYADPGFVNDQDEFVVGDTVYTRATGLTPRDNVYFVWIDAGGHEVRRTAVLRVDTQGMAFDDYTTLEGDPTGPWTVQLYDSGGALLESYPFSVRYDAEITSLTASNAPSVNSTVTVSASVTNHNVAPIVDSVATYLIWWDTDSNGLFSSGDIYIDSAGMPHAWDGTSPVGATRVTADVPDVAGGATLACPSWQIANRDFPNQGTYNVTMTWTESSGEYIDEMTTQFYSVPTLGWPLGALALGLVGFVVWRRRDQLAGGAAA